MIPSANLGLAKRFERAEGHACAMFAEAQQRVRPANGAEWMECAGVYAAFNGIDSPVTQTFGFGIFEEANGDTLDQLEQFFQDRGAPVFHEVSPLAGVPALELLCSRGYKPVEVSNVMYREVEPDSAVSRPGVSTRVAGPDETPVWSEVMAAAWLHDHPELREFFLEHGAISAACTDSVRFIAELDGKPGAAGTLFVHGGIALFGGAATVPGMRRRGLQNALIAARMQFANEQNCDLLMMVAEPGSDSQRNAERNGFRVGYTRTKWRLVNR